MEPDEQFNVCLDKYGPAALDGETGDNYMAYIEGLRFIVTSRSTLPNLEVLDWGNISHPKSFYISLLRSNIPIPHLSLSHLRVEEDFEFDVGCPEWPLRSLSLSIVDPNPKKGCMLPSSILLQCCSSLEMLALLRTNSGNLRTFRTDLPRFPKLKFLKIVHYWYFFNSTVWDALLAAPLSVLTVDYRPHNIARSLLDQSLAARGRIPSLETFVWDEVWLKSEFTFEFLRANTQLKALMLTGEKASIALEQHLLPILSSSFKALTSLSLVLSNDLIPDSALEIIASIHGLQQLRLGFYKRHHWFIDHKSMRAHLSRLPNLRKVAFKHDTYKVGKRNEHCYLCYENTLTADDMVDHMVKPGIEPSNRIQERLEEKWEEYHLNRMKAEAEKYAAEIPRLEWIYIGQCPMSLKQKEGSKQGEREATLLREFTPEVSFEDDWGMLRDIFGDGKIFPFHG